MINHIPNSFFTVKCVQNNSVLFSINATVSIIILIQAYIIKHKLTKN